VVASFRPQLDARQVEVVIADEWPLVRGDRLRLAQVYANLLDNAVKYIGDGSQPRVEIGHRQRHGATEFYVKDNGIGIAPENHQKVFEIFRRVNDPRVKAVAGSGIGLSIVQKIVQVHGGRVWVESEVGQGSTFVFTLPLSDGSDDSQ